MEDRGGSDWAYFKVRLQDGPTLRIRVEKFVLKAFNNSVLRIVRDRQERGELPPGAIASVETVVTETGREE